MLKQDLNDYPLSKAVRNGRCGTCPQTLIRLIHTCNRAGGQMPRQNHRQLQIEVLELMMDTVCDCLIDKCWRGWCLDNVYHPLGSIRVLSTTDQEKKELANIEYRMRTLSCYFLN